MKIRNASRVVLLTTLGTGLLIACSDSPTANPTTGGGAGGGGSGGSAGSMATSGTGTTAGTSSNAGTTSTAGTPATGGGGAGNGGAGGAGGALGGGGSGGTAGSSAGMGGMPPVQVPQVCNVNFEGKGDGEIDYERWLDSTGTGVAMIPVAEAADAFEVLTELRHGGTALEQFGARIRGYLTAPLAGKYRFWIAGDDNCELWLGTSDMAASKVKLASVDGADSGWTNDQQWNKFTSQKSNEVTLEADKKYYVEVLHKEGVNLDHVAVGWQLPGESGLLPCEVVPGTVLSRLGGIGEGGAGNSGEGGNGGAE